jgi:transcriptional regulator with XRE-family HTH domain
MKDLPNRLRGLRGSRSREDFADMLGLSRRAIVNYEQGERVPNAEAIEKICKRMGVAADWLLFGHETAPSTPPTPPAFDEKKPPTPAVFESKKSQPIENTTSKNLKTADVGNFSGESQEIRELERELRRALQEHSQLLREAADLRVEREQLRHTIVLLENELAEYRAAAPLPGRVPTRPATGTGDEVREPVAEYSRVLRHPKIPPVQECPATYRPKD